MLNAAEFLYSQIVISKSTRYDVNHRNSVTAPSVPHRESLYGDPSSYTGQKYCSHRQEHGMVFRSPVRHPIVEPQGYFHEVDLSVCCTNSNHAGAPLQNWTNKYTVIYLNGYGWDVASDGMNSEGLSVGALYLPDFTKDQVHI